MSGEDTGSPSYQRSSTSNVTRSSMLEQLYTKGTGYNYGVTIALKLDPLREMLKEPVQATFETELNFESRHGRWQELEKAHQSAHLFPLPRELVDGARSLLVCVLFIGAMASPVIISKLEAVAAAARVATGEGGADEVVLVKAGAGEHGHEDTFFTDMQACVLSIIGIIAFTLLLKLTLKWLEEVIPREMRGVLDQIYEEFTVLGFLGVATYFMVQLDVLQTWSFYVYGDHEHLVHLFEKVHFDLFFVLLIFMGNALWLMICAFYAHRRWQSYERFVQLHAAAIDPSVSGGEGVAIVQRQRILVATTEVLRCQLEVQEQPYDLLRRARLTESRHQLEYVLMRDRFTRIPQHVDGNGPGDEFELHAYLLRTVCEHVRDAIELTPKQYLAVLAMILPLIEWIAFDLGNVQAVLVGVGLVLVLLEWAVQLLLQHMMSQLTQHSPLLQPNALHEKGQDPRELDGKVWFCPLPQYLREGHWTADAIDPNLPANVSARKWTRQQALYDLGTMTGSWWLKKVCRWLNIGQNGRRIIRSWNTISMLTSSLYVVIAFEAGVSGQGPVAILYMVPAALVIFFGKPGMVQKEHTLRQGLRAVKLLYQLASFRWRRAQKKQQADDEDGRRGGGGVGNAGMWKSGKKLAMKVLSGGGRRQSQSIVDIVASQRVATAPGSRNQGRRDAVECDDMEAVMPLTGSAGKETWGVDDAALTESVKHEYNTLMTDASRRHEWKFLFNLLDMPEGDAFIEFSHSLKAAYHKGFGHKVPGLSDSLMEESDDAITEGEGDGQISFFELAFFMSHQECLPMYYVTHEEIVAEPLAPETEVKLSDTLELFATIKQEYLRLARQAGGLNMEWNPQRDLHQLYRQGIPFEAFYFVMANDEREMETDEGALGLAANLFNMVDGSLGSSSPEEAGDGTVSRQV